MSNKVERDGPRLMINTFQTLATEDEPKLYEAMHRVAAECHKSLGCRNFSHEQFCGDAVSCLLTRILVSAPVPLGLIESLKWAGLGWG